jgi:sigma-B regulation protein RsbU (phosphoserine phosphatase)
LTDQPQPTAQAGWRQFLKLGEQLMAAPTLAAQYDLIVATTAHLLKCQADLWLAEVFHHLPGLGELASFPIVPSSELMRCALDTRRVCHREADTGQAQPLAVAAPLLVNDVLLGVLQAERREGPPFSESEINLLNGLALQSALALRATLQVEVERWRVEQLSLMRMVSAQVAEVLDLDQLFHRVADLILNTFKYYYVALFTLEPGQEILRFRASAGPLHPHLDESGRSRAVSRAGTELHARLGQGIIGHVAQTGEEILANDVSREPRYRYEDALPETRSEVALPLKIENRILGVLDVQSDQPDDFQETDMLVLRALAHNISIAVEDARLYGDLQRRADQLSAVAEASRAVASILDLDQLLDEVVSLIHQRFGYPFVHLFTVHPGRRQVIYRAGSGRRSRALQAQGVTYSLEDPQGIIPWVARHGETVIANDVDSEPRYRPSQLPSTTNTRAELAVPLIFGGEVLGVLDVQSDRRNAFGDDDRFLFEALADNVAIAIRNANLYRSERWRRHVADSLREVAGLLSADLALDQVLAAILTELERTLPCDAAAIWLLRDDDLHATLTPWPAGRNQDERANQGMRLAAVRGCTGDDVVRASDLSPEVAPWLDQALGADQPSIRTPQSPFDPLGAALEFPSDYSAIAAPLRAGDQRLGLLVLVHRSPGRYGSESQAMTAAFASYAAVAIENARLYEAAQEQAWISTVLLQVAEAIQTLSTLDQVLEAVVRLVPMLVGVERCALLLSPTEGERWDEIARTFVPAIAHGFSPSQQTFFEQWHIAPGEVLAFDHLRLIKSPIPIRDATHDPRLPEGVASALGFESLLIMPLLTRGEVLGAMLVDYPGSRPEFEEERLAIVRGIAHQTAAAVENARLLEARQEEAYVSAALLQVAQAVVSFNDLEDILSAIVRIIPMLVGVEWCIIFLWETEHAVFRLAQAYGIPGGIAAALLGQRYAPGDFPLLDAIRESDDLLTLDAFSDWDDLIPSGFADDFVAYLRSATERHTAYQAAGEAHSLLALPLSVKGDVLGVMLLEESAPSGRLRERRLEIITGIARQTALAVQNDLLQQEMAERERLERELQLAHEIQQTFMPGRLPELPGWELAVMWRAARQVAGDFYDFFELPGGRLGLVIADVADKGMPAALFMTLTRTLVRAAALEEESPAAALARVNDLLVPDAEQGMFVTGVYAVLSLETGQLIYANAGHPPPLLLRSRTWKLERLGTGGMALGVLQGISLEERVVSMEPGVTLVFYTDGVTEAFSPEDDMYGAGRLRAAIRAADGNSAQAVLDAVSDSVTAFVGDNPPSDDITLMVLRRLA